MAAQITKSASGKGEKRADYGEVGFADVSAALLASGRMPTLRIDGPFGAPAEDVFKSEGNSTPKKGHHHSSTADMQIFL